MKRGQADAHENANSRKTFKRVGTSAPTVALWCPAFPRRSCRHWRTRLRSGRGQPLFVPRCGAPPEACEEPSMYNRHNTLPRPRSLKPTVCSILCYLVQVQTVIHASNMFFQRVFGWQSHLPAVKAVASVSVRCLYFNENAGETWRNKANAMMESRHENNEHFDSHDWTFLHFENENFADSSESKGNWAHDRPNTP